MSRIDLYTNGTQNVAWRQSYASLGSNTVQFRSGSIYVYTQGSVMGGTASVTTSGLVDVTGIGSLFIRCTVTQLNATASPAFFISTTDPNSNQAPWEYNRVATVGLPMGSNNQTFELDVSEITGSYYVGFYTNTGSASNRFNEIEVFEVWGITATPQVPPPPPSTNIQKLAIGNNALNNVFIGNTSVARVYVGTTIVFQKEDVVFPTSNLRVLYDPSKPNSFSGTTIIDLSGNGRNATNTGSFITDFGGGFRYNGSNQAISNLQSSWFGQSFTMSFWIKFNSSDDSRWLLNAQNSSFGFAMSGRRDANNVVSFRMKNTGNNSFGGDAIVETLQGVLYNIIIVASWNDEMRFYVNGNKTNQFNLGSNGSFLNGNPIFLFRRGFVTSAHMPADLFHWALWNRKLTDAEALSVFNHERGRFGI